jgi:hypothetical protein
MLLFYIQHKYYFEASSIFSHVLLPNIRQAAYFPMFCYQASDKQHIFPSSVTKHQTSNIFSQVLLQRSDKQHIFPSSVTKHQTSSIFSQVLLPNIRQAAYFPKFCYQASDKQHNFPSSVTKHQTSSIFSQVLLPNITPHSQCTCRWTCRGFIISHAYRAATTDC